MSAVGEGRLLRPLTVAILLTVGIASFIGTLLMGAYAPDLQRDNGAGGHALSDAATGYSGLVRLAEATGRHPRVVRNVHQMATEDLVVATPPSGGVRIDPVLGPRRATPTLIVLPKWRTSASEERRGWVTVDALAEPGDPQGVLAPAATLELVRRPSGGRPLRTVEPLMTGVAFVAPRPLQAIRAARATPGRGAGAYGALEPLVTDEAGNIVVGRFSNRPLFVLADPDLLDNRGVHDARNAASALAMLDFMNSNQTQDVAFDVTLNGLGGGVSPLKLLFEPPFVATTLTIAAALLLAALGAACRFGSPRPRARAIAFGKAALVDNTAALIRKAGREVRVGGGYADVVREAAARAFAAPARLRGAALDAYLDGLGRGGARFTTLAEAVMRAEDNTDLVSASRALHAWLEGTRN